VILIFFIGGHIDFTPFGIGLEAGYPLMQFKAKRIPYDCGEHIEFCTFHAL